MESEILKLGQVFRTVQLHTLTREGFSALKAHIVAAHADQIMLEQRILSLEAEMHRVKKRLHIGDVQQ
jgi:BMFP domain-containing protein YqiC